MEGLPTDSNGAVILTSPLGELETIDPSEAQQALQQGGYQLATPEQIHAADQEAKYGTVGQQLATGVEGAASAATFGGSTALETGLGISTPEDIAARRETNPISHGTGQVLGLAGSSLLLPGAGAAGVMTRAGEAATEAVGLGTATTISRVGSNAIKYAAENALFQSGDEVSKMFSTYRGVDPSDAIQTALVDVGLAAAFGGGLGGGMGAVSPLWSAVSGAKATGLLKSITEKLGGVEGGISSPMEEVASKAGIELSPEAKAVISKDPVLQDLARPLMDSQTETGIKFQESLKDFRGGLENSVLESMGKTPEDIANLSDYSSSKAGTDIQEKLSNKIKSIYEPIKKDYEAISNRYSTAEFNQGDQAVLEQNLTDLAKEKGWTVRSNSPEAKFLNQAIKDIGEIKNLEHLRQFGDSLSSEAVGMSRWDISRDVGKLFDNAEESFVKTRLGAEAPELLGKHEAVTQSYKDLKGVINELNGRLRVGSQKGPASFIYKLNDMVPEQLLNRLSQTKDAEFIKFLNERFPEIQSAIKDYQLNKVLQASGARMGQPEAINLTSLFKQVNKMSPELRSSLFSPEAIEKLSATEELWRGLNEMPKNTSGTAGALQKIQKYMPATAGGALSLLLGHSPFIGAAVGHLAEIMGHDVPDAIRLGLIKFLGSSQPIEAEGFKAMVDFIQKTTRGENLISKSTKAIFKAGQEVLPQALEPSVKKREKLDKELKSLQKDPSPLFTIGKKAPYYLPEHGSAMAQTGSNAVNVLNSLRPAPSKQNPLDSEPVISKAEKHQYDRALDIAEQPLAVMQDIKNGTLTPKDVQLLNTLYPALYKRLSMKLQTEMIHSLDKGMNIPYKTRMGLSLFLGQPLDSTMTPGSIQAAQPILQAPPQMGAQMKKSSSSLSKLAPMYATRSQSAEAHRLQK